MQVVNNSPCNKRARNTFKKALALFNVMHYSFIKQNIQGGQNERNVFITYSVFRIDRMCARVAK